MGKRLHDLPELREKTGVFRDRKHAGQTLATMLREWQGGKAIILAVPAGGVPVAMEVATVLACPLDVAVVSKILLPWDTEAGFGAVSFDGTVWINEEYVSLFELDQSVIEQQTQAALEKVQRRVKLFRSECLSADMKNQTVILVDDGIAAGSTMRAALMALHNIGVGRIIVAVPTAHRESLAHIMDMVDAIYCPNIRSGLRFAVASAYKYWDDVDEADVSNMLTSFRKNRK